MGGAGDFHECRLRHGVLKLFEGDRHEWLFGPDEQRRHAQAASRGGSVLPSSHPTRAPSDELPHPSGGRQRRRPVHTGWCPTFNLADAGGVGPTEPGTGPLSAVVPNRQRRRLLRTTETLEIDDELEVVEHRVVVDGCSGQVLPDTRGYGETKSGRRRSDARSQRGRLAGAIELVDSAVVPTRRGLPSSSVTRPLPGLHHRPDRARHRQSRSPAARTRTRREAATMSDVGQ